jgi:hypothetical protein
MLTIAISIASGVEAVFSLLPPEGQVFKFGTEFALVGVLLYGTDSIEELTKLAERVNEDFPASTFFTSKFIFESDNWYIRQLHSEAALTMLRRLHLRNMPMVILPMRLRFGHSAHWQHQRNTRAENPRKSLPLSCI